MLSIRRILLLSLLSLSSVFSSSLLCPVGYILSSVNNQCYTTTIESYSWTEARSQCEILGSVLATITSIELNNFIRSSFNQSSASLWIGYNDLNTEGDFLWESGQSASFTHWILEQPDNSGNENCVEMTSNGEWDDRSCNLTRVGICEQLPTDMTCPDGYTISLFNSRCYKREVNASNWYDAQLECQSQGATLATITSLTLNTILHDSFGGDIYRLWIGLNDIESEGVYVWDSGDNSSFRNWDDGQPDSSGGNEDCVVLWFAGGWNDAQCTTVSEYIFFHFPLCEKYPEYSLPVVYNPTPQPTSLVTKYAYAVLFQNQSVAESLSGNDALLINYLIKYGTRTDNLISSSLYPCSMIL
jgi:hypothetical protein